jgi:hypothetical protein
MESLRNVRGRAIPWSAWLVMEAWRISHPSATRAHLPKGYGLRPDSPPLSWTKIDQRLRAATHYWIATVGHNGAPIVRPVDGMWHDSSLYFGGDPASQWRRNLTVNPRASIHFEDADPRAAPASAQCGVGLERPLRRRHAFHVRMIPPGEEPRRDRLNGGVPTQRPVPPRATRTPAAR